MPSRTRSWTLAALLLGVPASLAAACGPPPAPPAPPDGSVTASPPSDVTAAPTTTASAEPTTAPTTDPGQPPVFTCALPAP